MRQLEEMDRLKGEFVTVASHELREPLRRLSADLREVLDAPVAGLGESDRVRLRSAASGLEGLRALVDDLLDLSKLESGRAELDRGPVLPELLLSEAVGAFRGRAEEKGIAIAVEAPREGPRVLAAQDEIGRVLGTLISNAIRFTDAGGRIVLTAEQVGDQVQFSVADNGREIPLEEQARVFDRFVPLARGRSQEGTGLGLAIARGIVRAHGGEIWVDSGPGPGCVFSFSLPIASE